MPKTSLEQVVAQAAREFALQVVEIVKGATLQELVNLSDAPPAKPRRGRKPAAAAETVAAPVTRRKTKKPRNYPKCAFPGCNNNRFVRGGGYCGEHWHQHKAGKIGPAANYIKEAADTSAETAETTGRLRRGRKKTTKATTKKSTRRVAKKRTAKK